MLPILPLRRSNVKKLLLLALCLAGLVPAAHAQVFGQYTSAEILPVNGRLGGAYVDFSDNVIGAVGQLRQSFYPNVEFGFQGGLARLDFGATNKTELRLGADARVSVLKAGAGRPVDVTVGGALGVEMGDQFSVFRIGPSVAASHTFPFSSRSAVVPYAGAMLCFTNWDAGDVNDTDFSVPVRLGAELRAIPGLHLAGELQLRLSDRFDDHTRFAVGANFPF
jgi:hypothetical protein